MCVFVRVVYVHSLLLEWTHFSSNTKSESDGDRAIKCSLTVLSTTTE